MLPAPISFGKSRKFHRTSSARRRGIVDVLLSRSRTTNLAVSLLATLFTISLLCNLQLYSSTLIGSSDLNNIGGSNLMKTMTRPDPIKYLKHLIIVPGHAIWRGIDPELKLHEEEWILEPYQRGGDRVATFFRHISQGAELVMNDEHSLLVFSGGQTRPSSTTTEAESYLRLAVNANLFQTLAPTPHFFRATTEDHALDSFQNLLFSIARFHEYVGRYPEKITVIGYEFKRQRFTDLHRAAIRWPQDRFHYIGLDPPNGHSVNAERGERMNGYLPYSVDTYGCHSSLASKRTERNRFLRFHSYYTSSPELKDLFDWCPNPEAEGSDRLFTGALPWDRLS